MARCPHCGNTIDHLKYEADYNEWGREYGTCSLDGSDWEQDERDSNDSENSDSEYRCPDCEEIVDPDELDDDDDDDDDENDEDEEITDGGNTIRPVDSRRASAVKQPLAKSINCPECGTLNFPDGDQMILCSNCNHEIIIN